MKKLTCLFSFILLFISFSLFAQDWRVMMHDPKYNVHDVQEAFYKWYAQQPVKAKVNNPNIKEQGEEEEESNGAYTLFRRWEAFYVPRTYPSGNRPDPAIMEKEYNSFLASQKNNKKSVKAAGASSNWSYIGNTGDANLSGVGRVNHVRFMPGNPNTIFACTPSGGLWKSINGGTSWTTNTDNLIDLAVDDIAINPLNTNIQYIAMGDGDGGYAGYTPSTVGVLKSYDGGNTWNPSGLYFQLPSTGPSFTTIQELLLNPVDTGVIFAASTAGLYYSSNGGLNWTAVIKDQDIRDVQFMPGHTEVVYASSFRGTFWRSTNSGVSFTKITGGWSAGDRLEIGVTPADSEYVYVLAGDTNTGGFAGVYLSTNGGVSFTTKSTSSLSVNPMGWSDNGNDKGTGQAWYDLSIAVSPTNKDSILIGGVDIWASSNDGASFGSSDITSWDNNPYVHADIHHLIYAPGSGKYFLAACDGGVFNVALSAGSTNPTDIGNNLGIAQQYGMGNSQQTSTEFITGWQDNGTNLSAASSTAWTAVQGGDGTLCFIDYTNQNNQYASYPDGTLYFSNNGGGNFSTISNGITGTAPWLVPFLEDPKTPNTIYCGFQDVFQSTNQGTKWTKKSTWGGSANLSQISAIAIDSSVNTDVYAAGYTLTSNMLEFTSNITATTPTWTNIMGSLPNDVTISAIAVNPKNPAQVWVTFSGYSNGEKVYYSANGNTASPTWTNISTGLPNLPVNCIFYESGTNDGIYVGIDGGVYYRNDTTAGWINFSSGLPNTPVNQITEYNATHTMRVATFGRGTWGSPHWTNPTTAPVAMFSGYPVSYCVNDTVHFTDTSSGQPTSWSWSFPGGNPSTSTVQNPVVVYATAGTYSVSLTATNGVGNNTLNQPTYITVNPTPAAPAITQIGQTLNSNATGASYQWYFGGVAIPGATSSTYTGTPGLSIGTYGVIVTSSSGCSSAMGTIIINPSVAPTAAFTASTTTTCANDTVQFTDNSTGNPTSWKWTFQGGNPATSTVQNPTVIYSTAGTYSVSLTATNSIGNNTLNQPTYITVNPDPATPTVTQSGQTLTCTTVGTTYQWYFNGKAISGATLSTYTGSPTLALGTYGVVITNSFGCSSVMATIVVDGINELSVNNSISVFPNPTNGNVKVTLTMPKEGDYKLSVSDVLGRIMFADNIHITGTYSGNIDMSGYSKGIYFISVKDGSFLAVKKVVVY
ncbi:MAG TPA: PKD domain-containing protein [Bacteroidia bacterium]|nr:PKD domain-containing protein [Bacteroidia bacterium]